MTNNLRVVTSKVLIVLVAASAALADTPPASTTPASAPAVAIPAAAPPAGTKATPATAPAAVTEAEDKTFSKEELEQLVAPIALYPDALLTQMLMAATYPLEIVQADRYMRANPSLKGDALEAKLKDEDWDASVKGLCSLPDVLKKMSQNLDWTQDLGDAFLGQQAEVLDTVQRMRGKANDAGTLKSSEQQKVTVQQDKIIVIESTSPEVVYVPTYSPTVVYPGWSYPYWHYPYWYAPVPYGYGLVSFGIGIAVGAAIWGGCRWGWGGGSVNVNINRYNNFNRNTSVNPQRGGSIGNNGNFNHNASHRKGVGYQNSKVAGQYGAKAGTNRASTSQARGRSGSGATAGTQNRAGGAGQGAGNRGGGAGAAQNRAGGAGQGASSRAGATSSGAGSRSGGYNGGASSGRSSGSYGSYGGSRGSSSSSYRGSSSRGTSSYGGSRGGGGGYRGGGGGMRGGGGGGRRR